MGHDQFLKDVLRTFLREFLELFYPDVAARLSFRSLTFLDKEVFTDFPSGRKREADLVARVKTRDGKRELVLVHLEVQVAREPRFEARMFQYYALLWVKYRLPIFPVVVYLRVGRKGLVQEEYRSRVLERDVLRFRYECVRFSTLEAKKYAAMANPVAAALAALMSRRGVSQVLTLRALLLNRIARSDLDDARKSLLVNLVETYFALTPRESRAFRRLLGRQEFQEVRTMQVTWADKMIAKGRRAGLLTGKRETLLRLLELKFGDLPPDVASRVKALKSISAVDKYLDRLVSAPSLAEMGLDRSASGGR